MTSTGPLEPEPRPPGHPEPFAAVLVPEAQHLRSLRTGIAAWLDEAGVDAAVRDALVLATHEAAASAMASPDEVAVDATLDDDAVTVVVSTDDGWMPPGDEVDEHRMLAIRELATDVSFATLSGRSSLRFERPL